MSSPDSGKRNFFVAPVFHKPLKDLATSQGECIVLECRVKGQPPPTITWRREGDLIEDCPDFRLLHRGEVATLVIGEAFPEDSGRFTCEAVNKAGTTTTSCRLSVKGGGYHTVSTKSAAASQAPVYQRPTQVLPAYSSQSAVESPPHIVSSHLTSSSSSSVSTSTTTTTTTVENQQQERSSQVTLVSTLNIFPKPSKARAQTVIERRAEEHSPLKSPQNAEQNTVPPQSSAEPAIHSRSLSPASFHSPTRSASPVNHFPAPPSSSTSSQVTHHVITPPGNVMTTIVTPTGYAHNADENHNFKAEKDQIVQDLAKQMASPTAKTGKQRTVSRELAIIERDIQQRLSLSSPPTSPLSPTAQQDSRVQGDYILYSPTLAAVLEIEPQEYRVSSFEQRLMNEIEYRLERTPPITEDPEDGVFADVPLEQQRAPNFVTLLKNFKALDGTSAKLTCRVSANPKAKVFWFKDGKQISKRSQHYLQSSDGDGNHELSIPHLCMDDDGNYTALATNPQGRASSTGRLAMISGRQPTISNNPTPDISQSRSPRRSVSPGMTSPPMSPNDSAFKMPERGELASDEESPVEKYYRPTFIQKPHPEINADEGKLVRLNVKLTGLPTPEIQWLINGRPVIQDALHKMLVRENNVHSLLLERVSPMDEGQYSIIASNKAGKVAHHVQLHVAARAHMTAPAFVQRLSAQCVGAGEPVRLEARVVGTPRPIISWKKGSDQVIPGSRIQLYQDDSGYICLQITQANMSDASWYTCSATNKAGISSCNGKLEVYSPTCDVPTNRRRIRTPHRYANLAKVAGVDMREALSPDAQAHHFLPESEEL